MIQKNFSIEGNGHNLFEMPEPYIYGTVSTGTSGYVVTEIAPRPNESGGAGYILVKPSLPIGETLNLTYKVKEQDTSLRRLEKNAFKETVSNRALIEIIAILKDIIETQDNLLKEMKQRVTYSQLDTAVYPIKEKIDLIEKTLELKAKKKP
jgi:hypothetical protein|nr:MAG TPA: hypothetical protein [Caudoviricetes sp.]